jgi:hypothetical protein
MKALVVFLGYDILFSKFFFLDIPADEDLLSFQVGEPKNHRNDVCPAIECENEFLVL